MANGGGLSRQVSLYLKRHCFLANVQGELSRLKDKFGDDANADNPREAKPNRELGKLRADRQLLQQELEVTGEITAAPWHVMIFDDLGNS